MHFSSASCVLFAPCIFTILDLITITVQYLSKYCQHIFSAFLCGKNYKHVLVKTLILVAQSAVYICIPMKQLCYIICTSCINLHLLHLRKSTISVRNTEVLGGDHKIVVTSIFQWNKAAFPALHSLGGFILFAVNFVNVYKHVWKFKIEITKFRLKWNNENTTKPLSSCLLYGTVSNFDFRAWDGRVIGEWWLGQNMLIAWSRYFLSICLEKLCPSKYGLVKIADDQADIWIGHFPNTRSLSTSWVLVY
jgi:hypothetical protein